MTAPFKDFLCDYQHGGRRWSVEIKATSLEDASRRLRAIGTTGQVRGIVHLTIKVAPDRFGRFYTWLRNIGGPA